MHQRKSKIILIYFFLLILFGSINNINLNKMQIIKIKNINVSGLDFSENQKLLSDLKNINLGNIFVVNQNEIKKLINFNPLIENYKIFKVYPSTLDIKIAKTSFIAKINLNGKTFIVGSNGKLSNDKSLNKKLPYIFGNPEINEFLKFKKVIDQSKISYQEIKSIYFFQSKRWDLEFNNKILVKLSNDFTQQTLDNIQIFMNDKNLNNIKILDARIKNQIIING